MCASCVKRAIADETAMEIYHRGVDINGDVTLDLEYALPRATKPAQPVHRAAARPEPRPEPAKRYVTRKPCETCTGEITLNLGDDDGSMLSFTLAEQDFKAQTRCGWCSTLGLNVVFAWRDIGEPTLADMHRYKNEFPDKFARILAKATKPRELRPAPAGLEAR